MVDDAGDPAVGWKVWAYTAGSSTPQDTYTTSAGSVAQTNPIILNSLGFPETGQIWLTAGQSYKLVLTNASDVVQKTEDNIDGVNDTTTTADQWAASGLTPTYVSGTSFTLSGDQTSAFHVGRRLKTTNSGGTVYSTITDSAYTSLTTITVVNDAGTLDAGLSAVSYGILSKTNDSMPRGIFQRDLVSAAGRNFVGRTNSSTPNSKVDFSADELVVKDSSGNTLRLTSVSVTSDIATSGANGLDTGAEGSNTTYFHFVIAKADGTKAGLLSASATAPTLPSGYTFFALVQVVRNDGSSNFIPFRQAGDTCYYQERQNVLSAGSATSTTAVSLATFVPSVAASVLMIGENTVTTNAGSGSNTSTIEIVSGSAFTKLLCQDSSASSTDYDTQAFEVPNISQNVNYYNTQGGSVSSATLSLWVTAFRLPIGGK